MARTSFPSVGSEADPPCPTNAAHSARRKRQWRDHSGVCRAAALFLHRLEVERDGALANLAPEPEPVLARRAEVDAGVDPGVRALPRRLREAGE
jgi:hypothetical protein